MFKSISLITLNNDSFTQMLKNYTKEELKQEIIDANYMQLELIERLFSFLEFVYNHNHTDEQGNKRSSSPNLKSILHQNYLQFIVCDQTVNQPRLVLPQLNKFYRLIAQNYKNNEQGLQNAIIDLLCSNFRYTIDLYQQLNNDSSLKRRTQTYNDLFSAKQLVEFIVIVFPQALQQAVDYNFVNSVLRLGLKLGLSFNSVFICIEDNLDVSNCSYSLDKAALQQQFIAIAYELLSIDHNTPLQSVTQIVDIVKAYSDQLRKDKTNDDGLAQELKSELILSANASGLVLIDAFKNKLL